MPKQNVRPADYPQAVVQEIERLAQNIVVARKRRGETQAQWARKLGVSLPTMARIERGDPAVSMASYAMCLWLIQPSMGLADLIAPEKDLAALDREVAKVRQKLRKPASKPKAASARLAPAATGLVEELRKVFTGAPRDPVTEQIAKVRQSLADQQKSMSADQMASDQIATLRKAILGNFESGHANNATAAGLASLLAKPSKHIKGNQ